MAQFIDRLTLRNYKSIEECDLELASVAIFLGRNGAGKSNIVDALDFVSNALYVSLENAVRDRGGIEAIRTRSRFGRPRDVEIALSFRVRPNRHATYSFRLAPDKNRGYVVRNESCHIVSRTGEARGHFIVENGKVVDASFDIADRIVPDRLYLALASSFPRFRRAFNVLSRMASYNLDVAEIRAPQVHDVGNALYSDGSNLASVITQMQKSFPERWDAVQAYLTAIVPDLVAVRPSYVGSRVDLEFEQRIPGGTATFSSLSMSDGTLRALAVLTALFQESSESADAVNVIALEEPEMALHPGGTQTLFDAIMEASEDKQVLITSHSPDLLDRKGLDIDALYSVEIQEGRTAISKMSDVTKTVVRDHLYTPGQLFRMGQLK